jgi:hypothetical protein
MRIPYIYTSNREFVRHAVGFDNQDGVIYQDIGGEHAVWAARVPFLPSLLSEDFTRWGKERIKLVMGRQFRFIYDLSRAREHRATFELRFISTPSPTPGQPNIIDIVFLGKAFSQRQGQAEALAAQLWDKFSCNFPMEDPYNYPLEPVMEEEEFQHYYEPFGFDRLDLDHIMEIRKFEDMPITSAAPLARRARIGDYIAHPFVPSVSFTPMSRFLEALAYQPQRCFVGISIRPTRMYPQEVHNVSFAIGQFKRTATEDDDVTEEYIRTRSVIGVKVYQKLMDEREHLMLVRVHVVGEESTPYGLAEALGSELMDNANNPYPTQWVAAQPADGTELSIALDNLRWLEHEFWGSTQAAPPLRRLRYLACAREASGAFRLPVPPESGYIPGVLVKNEPFVAPADELELRRQARANLDNVQEELEKSRQERKIRLGQVYHRGNLTPQYFTTSVQGLTRHALIGGSTGSGKTTTIKYLLAQLWQEHQVPFLVLYPIDKPDYRDMRQYRGLTEHLLIFTLGDERTSPFRFNPFEVPEGLLLKTHLSRLMRVFTAAFTLVDPLPMVYREALRQVYRNKGWDPVSDRGKPGRAYPVASEFYTAIQQITDNLKYGRDVQADVRQASVIRIGDLLENAGHVINVRRSMAFDTLLNRPTVMEIGRVGSMQDTALLMGFLLMRFAEEVERNPRPLEHPHITVVEEAHRLMAEPGPVLSGVGNPQSAAGEDFGNILAEVRGHGEGVIIAEQIPTLLVKGAIGNTHLKIMHWLEDVPSFDLFSSIMNLNDQQREYARTLNPGYALVRSPYGRPVHIKVPELEDQPGYDKSTVVDHADDAIHAYMEQQRARMGLADVSVIPWQGGLATESASSEEPPDTWRIIHDAVSLTMRAPFLTCAYCKALYKTRDCPHRKKIFMLTKNTAFHAQVTRVIYDALRITDIGERWRRLSAAGYAIEIAGDSAGTAEGKAQAYCYFAHVAHEQWQKSQGNPTEARKTRRDYRVMLFEFDKHYTNRKE